MQEISDTAEVNGTEQYELRDTTGNRQSERLLKPRGAAVIYEGGWHGCFRRLWRGFWKKRRRAVACI
jgi:hypothetical protein